MARSADGLYLRSMKHLGLLVEAANEGDGQGVEAEQARLVLWGFHTDLDAALGARLDLELVDGLVDLDAAYALDSEHWN